MSQLNLDKFPERKKKAFYICWPRKEAFLKATGDGVVQFLDKFNAGLIPGEPTRLLRMAEKFKNRIALVQPKLEARPSLRRRSCGKEPSA